MAQTGDDIGRPAAGALYGSAAYRWYVVAILMLAYSCHAMDRSLPGILVEPVREEFGLTDAQLGLLTGPSYGFAFAAAILPMGLLSDRVNRRNFLAVAVVAWSLCTALGGLARSYGQLLIARIGVGVAESGAAPVAVPMLSDIFPPERRAFVLGVFYMSSNAGTFLAGALGGYVAAEFGWRAAFLVVGLPGVLIALLMFATVREPTRGGSDAAAADARPAPLIEVLKFLAGKPALILLIAGAAMTALVSITMGAWAGSFFIRIHGLSVSQIGVLLGVGGGLVGMISPPVSGWVADRLSARDPGWTLRIVWISLLGSFVAGMAMLFSPHVLAAVAGFIAADLLRSGYSPLAYAEIMTHTPARMRGSVMSIVQLASVLVGFGLGPVVIGALSDLYGGGAAIRYALANALLLLPVVAVLFATGARLLYRAGGASGVAERP